MNDIDNHEEADNTEVRKLGQGIELPSSKGSIVINSFQKKIYIYFVYIKEENLESQLVSNQLILDCC